jgi:probable rRNA maturation factor
VAEEYTQKHGGDIGEEITLYLVHGFLHLLGYEDTTQDKRDEMKKHEKKWMNLLAKNRLGIILK